MYDFLIDAINAFDSATDDRSRWSVACDLAAAQGSPWLSAATATGANRATAAYRSTADTRFMADYFASGVVAEDPFLPLCARTRSTVHLDVRAALVTEPIAGTARLSALFHDHGVRHAVLHPVYRGNRQGGLAFYARDDASAEALRRPEAADGQRLLAALIAAYCHPDAADGVDWPRPYAPETVLTGRQREVLQWLAAGLTADQMADRMGLATATVEKHLTAARIRLGARTRAEALALSLSRGLIGV